MRTLLLLALAASLPCAPGCDVPADSGDAGTAADPDAATSDDVSLGARRVVLRGCPRCHDSGDGAMAGQDRPQPTTGAYGPNLTPDGETGIGSWSDATIARAIRESVDEQMQPLCPTMPRFSDVDDAEMKAIVAFLRSLEPVRHATPPSLCPPLKPGSADALDAGVPADGATHAPLDGALPAVADLSVAPPPDLALTPAPDLLVTDGGGMVAGPCAVRINEVQTGGMGGASDEFIELYNPCGASVDLDGHKLVYRASHGVADVKLLKFAGVKIPAHGFLVCANAKYTGTADLTYFGALAATGGGIALRDPKDNLADALGWGDAKNEFVLGSAAPAPPPTSSIELLPDGNASGDNARDFTVATPTPGAPNQ